MSKDGGPAFPQMRVWNAERAEYEDTQQFPGMTMRDYFAARAIGGMLADPNVRDMDAFVRNAPKQAYAIADAMLKARAS